MRSPTAPSAPLHPPEARAELAAVLDSSEDAITTIALDGTIQRWNPAAGRLYGYRAEEALGRPISMLVPPGHQAELALARARLEAGERVEPFGPSACARTAPSCTFPSGCRPSPTAPAAWWGCSTPRETPPSAGRSRRPCARASAGWPRPSAWPVSEAGTGTSPGTS